MVVDDVEGSSATPQLPPAVAGTGMITSSGVVVKGNGTLFTKELRASDGILVYNPRSQLEEFRVVRFCAADNALSLSSPFSGNIVTEAPFKIVRKPAPKPSVASAAAQAASMLPSTTVATFRVRKPNGQGYDYVTEEIHGNVSKEQLLDMRIKRKSDKFC